MQLLMFGEPQPNYTWILILLRLTSHLYIVLHLSNSDIIKNSCCVSQSSRALLYRGPTYHCVIVCLTFASTCRSLQFYSHLVEMLN